MRILMVNDVATESGWGAEAHLARLAKGLQAVGDTVELFAGEVTHHGASKVLDVWDPFARRALRARADRFRPDVVHYHNILRELSVSVLSLPHDVPTVMTVHEHRLLGVLDSPPRTPREFLKYPLSLLHRRMTHHHVDVLVGVSKHLARRLQTEGFPSVAYLPQFADAPDADVVALPVRETQDVVMAGRIARDKGASLLTDAFIEVAGRHPGARLLVAGEGPEEVVVAETARRLGGGRVRLMGMLDRRGVAALFARARVVVAPSVPTLRPEGAGTTPIEAALLGRPVIVSDDPGHREFVDESGGGIVVPAGSVSALAAALDAILTDDDLAQRLGDAGRRTAEASRTTTAIVPATRAIYERAIQTRRSRACSP